jgi:hypothetical protein
MEAHVMRFMLAAALALLPLAAEAQPRWDGAGMAGVLAGRRADGDAPSHQEDWFQAFQAGAVLGRYLSPHLKLEIEATATTTGAQHRSAQIAVPGSPYPYWITSERRTSVRSLGAVVAWQFRENEWVHPFVEAGVSADVDRTHIHTPEQFFYGDPRGGQPPRLAAASDERSTTARASAAVGGGAKVYFSERGFIRTDARLTLARDRQNVMFRGGVGFDF